VRAASQLWVAAAPGTGSNVTRRRGSPPRSAHHRPHGERSSRPSERPLCRAVARGGPTCRSVGAGPSPPAHPGPGARWGHGGSRPCEDLFTHHREAPRSPDTSTVVPMGAGSWRAGATPRPPETGAGRRRRGGVAPARPARHRRPRAAEGETPKPARVRRGCRREKIRRACGQCAARQDRPSRPPAARRGRRDQQQPLAASFGPRRTPVMRWIPGQEPCTLVPRGRHIER
jgi:hypothetical protein